MTQDDEEETEGGEPPLEKLLGHDEYLQFLGRYLHIAAYQTRKSRRLFPGAAPSASQ